MPSVTFAQVTITGMVENVAKVVWTVGTVIVIILWVITGILFLASQGDPGKLKTAKTALFTSIAGTVIIILAFSVAGIIENAIFQGV